MVSAFFQVRSVPVHSNYILPEAHKAPALKSRLSQLGSSAFEPASDLGMAELETG